MERSGDMVELAIGKGVLTMEPEETRRPEPGQIGANGVEGIVPEVMNGRVEDERTVRACKPKHHITPARSQANGRLSKINPPSAVFSRALNQHEMALRFVISEVRAGVEVSHEKLAKIERV